MIEISFSSATKGKEYDDCLSKLIALVENIERKIAELDKIVRGEEFINKCQNLYEYLNSSFQEQKECLKEELSSVYNIIESVIKESLIKCNNYYKFPDELKELIKEQINLELETDKLSEQGRYHENKIAKSGEVSLKTSHDEELGEVKLEKSQELYSASIDKQEPAREEDGSEFSQHSQPVILGERTASGAPRGTHTAPDSLATEHVKISDSSAADPNRVNVSESDSNKSLQDSSSNSFFSCDKVDRCALKNNKVSVTDPSVSVSSSPETCTTSSSPCALNIASSTTGTYQATNQDQTPTVNTTAPANTFSTVTTSIVTISAPTTTTSTVTSTASSTTPVTTHTITSLHDTLSVSTSHSGTLHTSFLSSEFIHKNKTSAELLPVAKQWTTGEPLQYIAGDTSISNRPHVTTLNGVLAPDIGEGSGEYPTENSNADLPQIPTVLTKLSNKKYLIIILALSSIILLIGPIIKVK